MRLPAVLLTALVTAASLRAEAPPLQGTLPEDFLPELRPLLQSAVERSPNTISAEINVLQQEANSYLDSSALYPSLNVNGGYAERTESESNSKPSRSSGFTYGANLGQPIFEWGAYRNNAMIGKLGVKIADRQYAEAYRLLATMIREQYMLLIEKKITLRNEDFKVKIAEEAFEAQKVRFQSGASSEAELQTFQLALDDERLTRDRAAEDFSNFKRQFMHLVGIEQLDDHAVPIDIPHPEYSSDLADAVLSGFVGNGIESTFQRQVFEMQVKQQEGQYDIAKVRLLPTLGFGANYSYSYYTAAGQGSVSQVGISSMSYGLNANWNLFDGFATRGAKMAALEAKRAVELQLKSYVDATVDSVNDMRHQLGFAARAQALAEIHYVLIDSQVKRLGEDRSLGFASQASIDTGRLNLYAVEYYQASARGDYLGRWTEFISLAGLDPAIDNVSPSYVR
jgi:outer membrane protein TolC